MPDYRRARLAGGGWFFTVNLLQRKDNDLLVRQVDLLREVVRQVRGKRPFTIDAWVVLPEHLHCIWPLPPGDADFSTRWRLIKSAFSRAIPPTEWRSAVRLRANGRGVCADSADTAVFLPSPAGGRVVGGEGQPAGRGLYFHSETLQGRFANRPKP